MTKAESAPLGAQTALSPQARPGNKNAVKHALYAAKTGHALRARRVRRLVNKLYAALPWLADSDMSATRAWADLELKIGAVSTELEKGGVVNDKGEPRRLLAEYRGLLALQLQYSKELGLTPAARASLGADVAKGQYLGDLAAEISHARLGQTDG